MQAFIVHQLMFVLRVRFLDGSSVRLALEKSTSVAQLRVEVSRLRGLDEFHEVKLLQGTRELGDHRFIEVLVSGVCRRWPYAQLSLNDALDLNEVRLRTDSGVQEAVDIDLQAIIVVSITRVIQGLQQGSDAALKAFERIQDLDRYQAHELLSNTDFSLFGAAEQVAVGTMIGRICKDFADVMGLFLYVCYLMQLKSNVDARPVLAAAAASACAEHGVEPSEQLSADDFELVLSTARQVVGSHNGFAQLGTLETILPHVHFLGILGELADTVVLLDIKQHHDDYPVLQDAAASALELIENRHERLHPEQDTAANVAPASSTTASGVRESG